MKSHIFSSIRAKLIVYFFMMGMIPFIYIGYEGVISARGSLKHNILQEIFLDVYSRGKDMENYLYNAKTDLLYLRGLPALGYFLEAAAMEDKPSMIYWQTLLEKEFFNFLNQKRDFSRIAYLDENGGETVVAIFDGNRKIILPKSKLENQRENGYFQAGLSLNAGEVAVVPLRNFVEDNSELYHVPLLRFIAKINGMDGKFKGIIYFDITGRHFHDTMSMASGNRPLRPFLVDSDGNFIFREPLPGKSDAVPPARPSKVSIKEAYSAVVASQILSGRPGIIEDQEALFFAYAPVFFDLDHKGPGYVVVYPYPKSQVFAGVGLFQKFFMAAGIAVVLATLLIGVWVSGKLTRPLFRLKEGVQRFGKGELEHRLDIKSGDEIEAVAVEFNRMAGSLKEYRDSLERKIEERTREIKKIEKQLLHSEKMGALGVLASGVAHEINNPMGIIINRIECIKMENAGKGLPEQVEKDLDTIRHHAVRVSNIAGNLLTLSRKTPQGFSGQDMHEILERILLLTERHLAKQNIKVERELSPALPKVRGSAGGLEQVFLNLIRNSSDAIGENGGTISIRSGYDPVKGNIRISFADTGPGIPEELKKNIFDPFFTTKEAGKGSGLGLYISYGIIQEHEGNIEVESNNGRGAVFTVVLPALDSAP
ncbi:MAG: sensor histidine kinase [Nitrospinae bacterium]|nr:sensor histidine kinase [Nitrospinota bacterium]